MRRLCSLCTLIVLGAWAPAAAQGWTFDARTVGLGGVGGARNIASKMVEEERGYHVIVLPIGLFQVLRNVDVFRPDSDQFDLVRAAEYASSPLHFVVGRDDAAAGGGNRSLARDIRNARVSRDLNDYRGFAPRSQPTIEGLAAPTFGGTIKVHRGDAGAFQGIYIGAGPYLESRALVGVDPQLTAILSSATPVYAGNAHMPITTGIRGEGAIAITGGYRMRAPLVAASADADGDRDGLYVAVNYNYLRGVRYENADVSLRLDTDNAGLLTIVPSLPAPLAIARHHSDSGQGFAIDAGVAVVSGPWEAGFGARGLGNRITWTGVRRTTYVLSNLLAGSAFVESPDVPVADERVELPVDYRGNVAYRVGRWTAMADAGHGFQGGSFHGGTEYRLPIVSLRGGGFYTRQQWQPTAGVGFALAPRVGLDFAVYGTSANAERERRAAFAASLRIGRRPE